MLRGQKAIGFRNNQTSLNIKPINKSEQGIALENHY